MDGSGAVVGNKINILCLDPDVTYLMPQLAVAKSPKTDGRQSEKGTHTMISLWVKTKKFHVSWME